MSAIGGSGTTPTTVQLATESGQMSRSFGSVGDIVIMDGTPAPGWHRATVGLDPESGRVSDILVRLSSVPTLEVKLLLTGDDRANAAAWEEMGIRVTGPHPDSEHIREAMGQSVGLVIVCGAGGASRALNSITTTSATIVVDANVLAVVRRPEMAPSLLAPDERAGAVTLQDHRRRRDCDLVGRADQVWCRSEAEAERVRSLEVGLTAALVHGVRDAVAPQAPLLDVE